MLMHYMLGSLLLAAACFVIGRLAGHPSLIGRKFHGERVAGDRPDLRETGATGTPTRRKVREWL